MSNPISSAAITSTDRLAVDANSLSALKTATTQNSPAAIKETAKQFEALFVSMMMKSMRKAMPSDGPMDSEQGKMFTSMLDDQISQKIASRGIGLSDMLAKQMMVNAGIQMPVKNAGASATQSGASNPITQHAQDLKAASPNLSKSQAQVQAFQNKLTCCAKAAADATGIPANFMMGQAALETGWGKHQITAANGQPSHNLFGIKAGSDWTGKTASVMTTEYVNGVPTKKLEKFRVYDNYDQSFNDYE